MRVKFDYTGRVGRNRLARYRGRGEVKREVRRIASRKYFCSARTLKRFGTPLASGSRGRGRIRADYADR
jgi:hypothetical protein